MLRCRCEIVLWPACYLWWSNPVCILSSKWRWLYPIYTNVTRLCYHSSLLNDINLLELNVLFKCLEVDQLLHVLYVQLEFGHCINSEDRVLFNCEIFYLLSHNLAASIKLWLYLEFLCFELFLVVFVTHYIVEVSLHSGFDGILKDRRHRLALMVDDEKLTLVWPWVSSLKQHWDITAYALEFAEPE